MKRTLSVLILISILALAIVSPALGSADDSVRVWIEYSQGRRAQVRQALAGAGAQFHYEFDSLQAFVVTLPANAMQRLSRNPNVLSVEVDAERTLVTPQRSSAPQSALGDTVDANGQTIPYGIDMVQARDIWDANRDGKVDKRAPTGAGRTVCIIDTGLHPGHEDIADVNLVGGVSQVDDDWAYDGAGHGTHVAGTVTAANNSLGVVGVTPGTVDLFVVKIFANDGLWVSKRHASDLLAAAYLCHDSGANIISMSLSGTSPQRVEEHGFDELYAAGVLSIAAASNDGIEDYHYPASYDSVISVAAIGEDEIVADFSQFNDQVELAAPGVRVLSTVSYYAEASVTVDGVGYSANHIEYAPYGSATGVLVDGGLCTSSGDWAGMVVLCERGEISFLDKVLNAQAGGGIAVAIYNNAPGNFWGTLGEEQKDPVVMAVSLSQEDGRWLVANKLGEEATVSSSITNPANGYESWDGTSMATPHVSGVAALIWSANPKWTNVQIREAMVVTAKDLGEEGRDNYYGYGLVQAYDALEYLPDCHPGNRP